MQWSEWNALEFADLVYARHWTSIIASCLSPYAARKASERPLSVLDVGCGNGLIANLLNQFEGLSLTGLDLTDHRHAECRGFPFIQENFYEYLQSSSPIFFPRYVFKQSWHLLFKNYDEGSRCAELLYQKGHSNDRLVILQLPIPYSSSFPYFAEWRNSLLGLQGTLGDPATNIDLLSDAGYHVAYDEFQVNRLVGRDDFMNAVLEGYTSDLQKIPKVARQKGWKEIEAKLSNGEAFRLEETLGLIVAVKIDSNEYKTSAGSWRIGISHVDGLGLFAKRALPEEHVLLTLGGNPVNRLKYGSIVSGEWNAPKGCDFILSRKDVTPYFFINHGAGERANLYIRQLEGGRRLEVTTRRAIHSGEEFLCDYSAEDLPAEYISINNKWLFDA